VLQLVPGSRHIHSNDRHVLHTPADTCFLSARHPYRGNAARLCALAGAPCAAKAVLATLLALPGAQGKKGAPGAGAGLEVNVHASKSFRPHPDTRSARKCRPAISPSTHHFDSLN